MGKLQIVLVGLILLLALGLRLHNYAVYPQRGASSDEYTYSFMGISLLTRGMPISWSNFSPYQNRYDLIIDNLYFPMVYPYFDHPPLNGILVGGWAILFGENTFEKISLKTIRLVPIFLSLISSVFVFLLGKKLYDEKAALWALLIYATATIFVMNGRVVFAENLLTPIILGSIYLFLLFKGQMTVGKTILLGLLCGAAFWTKELGVALFFALFYLFVTQKFKPRFTLILTLVFTLSLLGYAAYGAYYDAELFQKIIFAQADRIIGPQTLLMLTGTPIIVNKPYFDGWYFLGFLCLFMAFGQYRKHKFMLVPAAIYLMLMIYSLNRQGEMGWYMIVLFPFMAIAAAYYLVESLREQGWFIFIALMFVGLAQVRYLFEANFGLTNPQFRILIFLIFVPFALLGLFSRQKLFNRLGNFTFYLLIAFTAIQTYTYIHPF